jgi:hypothetical protein
MSLATQIATRISSRRLSERPSHLVIGWASLQGLLLSGCLLACAGGARNAVVGTPNDLGLSPPHSASSEASQPQAAVAFVPADPIERKEPTEPTPGVDLTADGGYLPPCALKSTIQVTRQRGVYHVNILPQNLTAERLEFDVPNDPRTTSQLQRLANRRRVLPAWRSEPLA